MFPLIIVFRLQTFFQSLLFRPQFLWCVHPEASETFTTTFAPRPGSKTNWTCFKICHFYERKAGNTQLEGGT